MILNQDKNFDIINSSDKMIDEVHNRINKRKMNGAKTCSLNLFLPTYSIAAVKISMKQVDYDQLFEMKNTKVN